MRPLAFILIHCKFPGCFVGNQFWGASHSVERLIQKPLPAMLAENDGGGKGGRSVKSGPEC